MSKISKITASSLFAAVFFLADKALAVQQQTTLIATQHNLEWWVPQIFNWVAIIAGLIFVVLFLVGGVQYLTAAGNEEQSSKAKKLLVDAVVGLIIVLVAYAAGTWILGLVGFQPGVIPGTTQGQ